MTSLALARREAGLCLREVAEKLQVTAQTVQQQEKRGIRSIRTARRYAAVLGCDWRDLLDDGPSDLSDRSDRSDRSDNKTKEE